MCNFQTHKGKEGIIQSTQPIQNKPEMNQMNLELGEPMENEYLIKYSNYITKNNPIKYRLDFKI